MPVSSTVAARDPLPVKPAYPLMSPEFVLVLWAPDTSCGGFYGTAVLALNGEMSPNLMWSLPETRGAPPLREGVFV